MIASASIVGCSLFFVSNSLFPVLFFHSTRMRLSESSPPALPTAGAGTFPPTHESFEDTVEVPALGGTGRDGSDAGGATPAAACLSADLGVAPGLLVNLDLWHV